MKLLLTTVSTLCFAAGAAGQMEKRWSGLFHLSKYELQAPAVGKPAPALHLFAGQWKMWEVVAAIT
ncbi:MAG: hypothetical protein ACPHQP_02060, partial [Longimicrobiales bacterium]